MNSYSRSQLIVGVIVAIVIVAGVGYVFWQGAHKPGFRDQGNATTTAGTTTTQTGPNSLTVSGPDGGGYTITQVPIEDAPKAPPYKSGLTCSTSMSKEQCATIQGQDATAVARIETNVTDFAAWVQLGALREEVGDYQGAATAWGYVKSLYPTNPTVYLNLADLYTNFLKDYAKGEQYYLSAMKYLPTDTSIYANLFTVYTTTSYKPSASAAEDILKKGIAANPKAIDLPVTLARYYKSLGRSADAQAQYNAAIANAKAAGNTDVAAQIEVEAAK